MTHAFIAHVGGLLRPVPIPPRDFRSERSHERRQWEGNGYDYGEWGDWQKGASLNVDVDVGQNGRPRGPQMLV